MSDIPNFPEFIDIADVDPSEYVSTVQSFDNYSDFNYVSLFSWNQPGAGKVSTLDGNLALSVRGYLDDSATLSLLGNNHIPESVANLFEYQRSLGVPQGLELVPEVTAQELDDREVSIVEDADNNDYIFSAERLSSLQGGKFARIRQKVNMFTRNYGDKSAITLESLESDNVQEDIQELTAEWALLGTGGAKKALNEQKAIKRLLESVQMLGKIMTLECVGLRIGDELQGYSIFEIQGSQATVHFMKANLHYEGSSLYLANQAMRRIYEGYGVDTVNLEQDLGIEGLRQYKNSLRPSRFLRKYAVTPLSTSP